MNLLVVVQARANSTRLPRKIYRELSPGKSMLWHVLERAERLGPVFLATPPPGLDENDVLGRFWKVAELHPEVDTFVRITADCPLLDVGVSQSIIDEYLYGEGGNWDYVVTNAALDGLDTEVFSRLALSETYRDDRDGRSREHVTSWMREKLYGKVMKLAGGPYRWSVDDDSGLDFVRRVYGACDACRDGIPHHTNATGSIGGNDGRAPVWDLHVSEGGGLAECTAHDILMERVGGPAYVSQ